jgi:hypothetical protein
MSRSIAIAAAFLPTLCGGSSTNVQLIDLTDANPAPPGTAWLGAPCDPANPAGDATCNSAVGLACASEHTPSPHDVYGTCTYPCGTTIEAAQCAAWDASCVGADDAGAARPALGYCALLDGGADE